MSAFIGRQQVQLKKSRNTHRQIAERIQESRDRVGDERRERLTDTCQRKVKMEEEEARMHAAAQDIRKGCVRLLAKRDEPDVFL